MILWSKGIPPLPKIVLVLASMYWLQFPPDEVYVGWSICRRCKNLLVSNLSFTVKHLAYGPELGVHAYTENLFVHKSCKNYLPITIVPYCSFQAPFFKIHLYHAGVVKIICKSPLYHIARSKRLSLKSISSKYTFMYIFQNLLLQLHNWIFPPF